MFRKSSGKVDLTNASKTSSKHSSNIFKPLSHSIGIKKSLVNSELRQIPQCELVSGRPFDDDARNTPCHILSRPAGSSQHGRRDQIAMFTPSCMHALWRTGIWAAFCGSEAYDRARPTPTCFGSLISTRLLCSSSSPVAYDQITRCVEAQVGLMPYGDFFVCGIRQVFHDKE